MTEDKPTPREHFLASYEASRRMLTSIVYGETGASDHDKVQAARDLMTLENERMAL